MIHPRRDAQRDKEKKTTPVHRLLSLTVAHGLRRKHAAGLLTEELVRRKRQSINIKSGKFPWFGKCDD